MPMQIAPPQLRVYSRRLYESDLAFREAYDQEVFGERHQRLRLLFSTQEAVNV